MKIEIWSDFVCPYCYIGKRQFEKALDQFPHHPYVQIEYKSFELDPEAKVGAYEDYYLFLSEKFQGSIQQAKEMTQRLSQQAAEVGLVFRFESMKPTNTFNAHRFTKYASAWGKAKEAVETLFQYHFTLAKDIGRHHILQNLGEQLGLDRSDVESLLATNKYAKAVREDMEEAQQIGVQGVPFFVFNEKYAISGAQPSHMFLQVLESVWEEVKDQPRRMPSQTTYCCDEDCKGDD